MTPDYLWLNIRALPYFRGLLRAVEARLMQQVELPRPILDVGCGDGHFASVAFAAEGIEVGLDPDRHSLREARRRRSYRLLLHADGARIPAADGAFGSAFSNSVLEHVPRLDEVLAEIGRVLRPGAPLVFTVPNPAYRDLLSIPNTMRRFGLKGLAERYVTWFIRLTRTENLLDEDGWHSRLARAGFAMERTFRYFSPAALRVLEWGHYFGVPCLLPRTLLGRWIVAPMRWNLWLTDRLIRRYYDEAPSPDGICSFFVARRIGNAARQRIPGIAS
ncbi:MAG: class I SAM-dependent methyltransferase [Chloroflexota bacterium]